MQVQGMGTHYQVSSQLIKKEICNFWQSSIFASRGIRTHNPLITGRGCLSNQAMGPLTKMLLFWELIYVICCVQGWVRQARFLLKFEMQQIIKKNYVIGPNLKNLVAFYLQSCTNQLFSLILGQKLVKMSEKTRENVIFSLPLENHTLSLVFSLVFTCFRPKIKEKS